MTMRVSNHRSSKFILLWLASLASANALSSENKQPKKIGLAINAGVNVAAASGFATMRGFQQQTIQVNGETRPAMEAFDYISGTSGGIVPSVLYAYAQDADTDDLLDAKFRIKDSSGITLDVLNRKNKIAMNSYITTSLTRKLVPVFLQNLIRRDLKSFWVITSWKEFLKPFGIKRNNRIATISEEANNEVKENTIRRRSGVKAIPLISMAMVGQTADFAAQRTDNFWDLRAALEIFHGDTFVAPETIMEGLSKVDNKIFLPFVASPFEVKNAYLTDSSEPGEKTFRVNSVPTQDWGAAHSPTTFEFLVGAGTNLPGLAAVDFRRRSQGLASKSLMRSAQVRTVPLAQDGPEDENIFTDGGIFDCLSIPALVQQREVETIVASICGPEKRRGYAALYKKTKGESFEKWLEEVSDIGLAEITSYFGYMPTQGNPGAFANRMFEGGDLHLRELRETLDALFEEGKPLVATMKGLKTVDNPIWGIEGGKTLDLTIIYYSLPKDFVEKIPVETLPPGNKDKTKIDDDGYFTNKEFRDFPHYQGVSNFETKTKTWSVVKAGNLTQRQVNLYSYLGAWIINEAWDGLTVDGKKVFEGFKDLFEKALAD